MYLLADAAIDITCPSTEAFAYACDLENFAVWFPGVLNVTAENDLPFDRRGREYRETVEIPLRGRRSVAIRVVDSEPPRCLVTEGDLPILLPRMEIRINRSGPDACTVHWRMLSRNDNAFVRAAVLPLARLVMAKRAATGLSRLKGQLEEGRRREARGDGAVNQWRPGG